MLVCRTYSYRKIHSELYRSGEYRGTVDLPPRFAQTRTHCERNVKGQDTSRQKCRISLRRLQGGFTVLGRAVIAVCLLTSTLYLEARAGNPAQLVAQAYTGKHITISIYRQRLRAWDGDRVVLSTSVTTGNRSLPTPIGYFQILAKQSPFTFISPWPKGSPNWYPPSRVSYAMEFQAGGYYIHDAPWRANFGRGTRHRGGPGTNFGGTHGCVNLPYWAAHFLYFWAPIGTTVQIVR